MGLILQEGELGILHQEACGWVSRVELGEGGTNTSCWIAAPTAGSNVPISGNKLGLAAETHSGMKEF